MHWTPPGERRQRHQRLRIRVDAPNAYNEALKRAKAVKSRPALVGMGTWEADLAEYLDRREEGGTKRLFTKSSRHGTEWVCRRFFTAMGKETAKEISETDAGDYFKNLVGADSSRRTHYARVRGFVSWMVERGRVPFHFLEKVKVKRPRVHEVARKEYLEIEEIRACLDEAREWGDLQLRFILYCGLMAGMRKLEISLARTDWFFLDEALIVIPYEQETDRWVFTSKNKQMRVIPMPPEFRKFLEKEYLFSPEQTWALRGDGRGGNHADYRYEFRDRVNTFMKRFLEGNGLGDKKITIHGLRHSFASALIKSGLPLPVVAAYMGNTTTVLEGHYWHHRPQTGALDNIF
jgi:integrase